MIPPVSVFKPMKDAPRDGSTLMVVSREWNNPQAKLQVQPGQWLCDMKGKDWAWRLSGRQGTTIHADGWLTFEEFQAAQEAASVPAPVEEDEFAHFQPSPTFEPDPDPEEDEFAHFQPTPPEDFDL